MTSSSYIKPLNELSSHQAKPLAHTILDAIFACRLHVSVFTLAAVWGWSRMFSTTVLAEDYLIAPLIITCIYLWNRAWDLQEDQINCPHSTQYFVRLRGPILILAPLVGIGGIALASSRGPVLAAIILTIVLLVGFAYSAPMLPGLPGKRLKEFYLIKNLTSALGWIVLVTLYPALHAGIALPAGFLLGAAILFIGVWSVEIIWDIRDLEGDQQAGVATLPNILGLAKTAYWIGALSLISTAMVLIGLKLDLLAPVWFLALSNNILVTCWVSLGAVRLQRRRLWSHGLVVAQTGLFAAAGILAFWINAF
jgi:4-hydroxybenzoate polyprenyltransferase